jgi:hypothetical protein
MLFSSPCISIAWWITRRIDFPVDGSSYATAAVTTGADYTHPRVSRKGQTSTVKSGHSFRTVALSPTQDWSAWLSNSVLCSWVTLALTFDDVTFLFLASPGSLSQFSESLSFLSSPPYLAFFDPFSVLVCSLASFRFSLRTGTLTLLFSHLAVDLAWSRRFFS